MVPVGQRDRPAAGPSPAPLAPARRLPGRMHIFSGHGIVVSQIVENLDKS